MIIFTFLYVLFFIGYSEEVNNGLGRTPQMGKRTKKNLFEENNYINSSLSKDGIVGIILVVVSMKR